MTTNELKALVLLQRAEMMFYRRQGGDEMYACQCIERCAYYVSQEPDSRTIYGGWEHYKDEDFQTADYDYDQLWADIIRLRNDLSYQGRNFMFNLEDF